MELFQPQNRNEQKSQGFGSDVVRRLLCCTEKGEE